MKHLNLEEQIIDWFEGNLPEEEKEDFSKLINSSPEAKATFDTYRSIYEDFEASEFELPSNQLKERFYEKLEAKESSLKPAKVISFKLLRYAAAILLLVAVGILIGLNISKSQQIDELLALRTEMNNLLKNESTALRIKAVKMSNQVEKTDPEILDVLIQTMNSDKSKNVRLAAIDALEKFSHEKMVQKAFVQTLKKQDEDFIQIKLIRILAQSKDKSALPYLEQLINNSTTSKYLKSEAAQGKKKIINL